MHHQEVDPPDELRHLIRCFWYTRLDFGEQPATFQIVPDGYPELTFLFGTPCSLSTPDGWQSLPSPFLMGLLNRPVALRAQHCLDVIGVRCFPWTVFNLLDLPSGQAGGRLIDHPVADLQPVLAALVRDGNIAEALHQVSQYFLRTKADVTTDSTLTRAGTAMRAANGTLPVSQVAAAAHATVRTLERKFRQAAGHTVKDVSALIRFEQVRDQLWLNPSTSLTGLAHDFGYTDQAHLSREFKRFSGTTPAAFARQTRQAKGNTPDDFVAFVQA